MELTHRRSDWKATEPVWRELWEACPQTSFFLSPAWVGAWSETLGAELHKEFVVFEAGGQPVGVCLLVSRERVVGPLVLRELYLNTAGEDADAEATIEFNGLLYRPEFERAVYQSFARLVSAARWDAFIMPGCEDSLWPRLTMDIPRLRGEVSEEASCYVDLARLRAEGTPYDRALSSNTRNQVRRALKLYAKEGPVRVVAASTVPEAMLMLDELADLHQRSWQRRGMAGCFASERFMSFHRRLIAATLVDGGTHLLRVTAGDQPIGLAYCLAHRGKVCFYQSGLAYPAGGDNRYKPGFALHHEVICHFLERGLDEYDFLAGENAAPQYKRSLSTDARRLARVTLHGRTARAVAVNGARQLRETTRGAGLVGVRNLARWLVPSGKRTA